MKKLFLLFMILGLTSISFIDTQAFTFNGSYDFNDIDLDDSLTELNGASLNNIFNYDYLETLPLINYQGYRNGYELDNQNNVTFYEYIYIDLDYKNLFDGILYENGRISATGSIEYNTNRVYTGFISVLPNTQYSIRNFDNSSLYRLAGYSEQNDSSFTEMISNSSSITNLTFVTGSNTYYIRTSFTTTDLNSTVALYEGSDISSFVPYGVLAEVYRLYPTPIENTDLTQSLYNYNLENLPINTIKYYFAVFLLHKYNLPVDDLWNNAFNAGESSGYNTGYDFGLTDGFLQGETYGYNQGYDDGILSEVDTQWLLGFVSGTVNVLGVSIIPGISLGVFVFIPLFLGFIGFIFRLGGRRG
jgi:hypothetical protein